MAKKSFVMRDSDDDDNPPINPIKRGWRLMAVHDNPDIPPITLMHVSDAFVQKRMAAKQISPVSKKKAKK